MKALRTIFSATRNWAAIVIATSFLFAGAAFADKMRILEDPVVAAQVRVDLLQQAKKSIKAEYFIVGSDPLTNAGLALARDASWRGCDVKIIIDAADNRIAPCVSGYLMTQGVQIKVYHPFSWSHLSWVTRRMHDKGISIDGEKMVRGGRNVEDGYFGQAKRNFIDRDAYLEGKVVRDSDAYFEQLWNSDQVSWLAVKHFDAQQCAEGCRIMDDAVGKTLKSKKWKIQTSHDWGRGLPDVGPIRFLHDPVGEKNLQPGIAESLRDIVRLGHHSILLETPYLIPTPEFLREIHAARARGVTTIDILTNSMASNDGLFAQAGFEAAKGRLLRAGVNLWEFKGPDTLHAKSASIDGRWAVIGSFNIDPRSQHLNTETAVAVENHQLAVELARLINAHKLASWQLGPHGRPLEGDADYPGISLGRRIKVTLMQWTLPLLRGQL